MFPNEILLEIVTFLNKDDLSHLIFASKNICQVLSTTKTIFFYKNGKNILENSMPSLFIFKTIYCCSKNKDCNNLLKIASKDGYLEVVKFLVADGADVTTGGNFSVRFASAYGHLDVVKFLVENGANVTADNNYAICWASRGGRLRLVEYLAANGADLTADDNYPVRWASGGGHLEVVKFLVENGANVTAFDNYAANVANDNGHQEVVQYLIANGASLSVGLNGYDEYLKRLDFYA